MICSDYSSMAHRSAQPALPQFLVEAKCDSCTLRVYDVDTKQLRCEHKLPNNVLRCSIKAGSSLVAVACYNNRVYSIKVDGTLPKQLRELDGDEELKQPSSCFSVSFNGRGNLL